jgi:glycerol-3-phosphate dehydrogenase
VKRDLLALSRGEHDLLVIGGGIYGAAAAWDAVERGLKVALVEGRDFGSGTSWNSLRTIHGGLRYLQTLDLPRMRESVAERRALLRIAPRLVKPLPFVIPTYGHGLREVFALGLAVNDLLSLDRNQHLPPNQRIPRGRVLSPGEVLELFPELPRSRLTGGALWTDAQVTESERLIMAFLHSAESRGAVLANHLEVRGLLRSKGRIVGARARDAESGQELDVVARVVLNAAGPGMDQVLALAGIPREGVPLLRAMNLVLKRRVTRTHALGSAVSGRYLFLVPWRERSIVGTGYQPAAERSASAFLAEVRAAYPWAGIEASDVSLVHEGLVPGRGRLSTRPLILDHGGADGGLLSVQGVKYTTARGIAQRVVDRVFRVLGRSSPPCRTAVTDLQDPSLPEPLAEKARYVVRNEMALHLPDALLRRIEVGAEGPPPEEVVSAVAEVMSQELGWSATRLLEERRALGECYRGIENVGRTGK